MSEYNCKNCSFFLQDNGKVVCNAFHSITKDSLRKAEDCIDFEFEPEKNNNRPSSGDVNLSGVSEGQVLLWDSDQESFTPQTLPNSISSDVNSGIETSIENEEDYPKINNNTSFLPLISGHISSRSESLIPTYYDPLYSTTIGLGRQHIDNDRTRTPDRIFQDITICGLITLEIDPVSRFKYIFSHLATEESSIYLILKLVFPYSFRNYTVSINGIKGNATIENLESILKANPLSEFGELTYVEKTIKAYGRLSGFDYNDQGTFLRII